MNSTSSTNVNDSPNKQTNSVGRLMTLFAVIYIAEGMGQMGGLIGQPVSYYLLKNFNWEASQISAMLNVMSFPWFIRPIYGVVSDFVPLLGYRRKLYLVLANVIAVLGFLFLSHITDPKMVGVALAMTALGLAISSTLCGAVLVENGKKSGLNSKFVTQQWLWFYISNVAAMLIGGQLCKQFPPEQALHIAATVVSITILGAVGGCWFLLREEKSSVNLPAMKKTLKELWAAMRSRTLWVVGAFIFCYYFSPGLGTPLYVHMTKSLHFSQDFIGFLSALQSGGCIVGALLFKRLSKRMQLKNLVYATIVAGAVAQGAFIFLASEPSAIFLNVINGVCSMMAVLSIFTLAADHCPNGSEGFTYALLNSIHNATSPIANQVGSYLYDTTFQHNLTPLVLVSSVVTILSLVLIPVLKLGRQPQTGVDQQPDLLLSSPAVAGTEAATTVEAV